MKTKSCNLGKEKFLYTVGRISTVILLALVLLNIQSFYHLDTVHAAGPCGDTYIVLEDDTIESIADLCSTTVEDILDLNPEITDPDNLFPGQILRIPDVGTFVETVLAVAPTCGLAGQELLVVGSGYPIIEEVELKFTQQGSDPIRLGSTTSDQLGRIDTTIILPDSAEPGTAWFVTGETRISSAEFLGTSNKFVVIADAPNPNASTTYQAQEGDTLRTIAVKFNRDLELLLRANSQITETGQLTPGDLVNIPPQPSGTPVTEVNPICGPVETEIQVSGRGFPPATTVNLSAGPYLTTYEQVATTTSSPSRTFQALVNIPTYALIGERWVVIATTSGFTSVRSTSNIFTVTPPRDPSEPSLYIVEPGDTLNAIAAEFTQTVASILAVNPQITNPNQLEIGEKMVIPGQVETILIYPTSGPALTPIQVQGVGFSPFSAVSLGFTRGGNLFSTEEIIGTDVNGFFNTALSIPSSARSREIWNVVAIRQGTQRNEIITQSNDFTVLDIQPTLQPSISIWPLDGPPGIDLSVVGYNFPPLSQITYSFGREGEASLISGTIWSEINGTFAIDFSIPTQSEAGSNWNVAAEAVDFPEINATSQPFTVTNP